MSNIYTNARLGSLWAINPSSLAVIGTYNSFLPGAANAGIGLDTTNQNIYLPGIFTGSAVDLAIAGVSSLPPTNVSGSPFAMTNGGFRPVKTAYDSINGFIYIADFAVGLTAVATGSYSQTLYVPSGAQNVLAQGVCFDSTNGLVYTCCQNSSGQDCLAVYPAGSSLSTPTLYPVSSLALTSSYTSIAYDTVNDYVLITGNNPLGGLTVLYGTTHGSSKFTPIPGSPFSTGGLDSRGVAYANDGTYGKLIMVCNFGSSNLAILNASNTGYSPLPQITGSPFSTGGLVNPNAVAYSSPNVLVTNFNGTTGGLSVFEGSGSYTFAAKSGSPYVSGSQFIEIVVG